MNTERTRVLGGVVIAVAVAMLIVGSKQPAKQTQRDDEIVALESKIEGLEIRVQELENLVVEVSKEIEAHEDLDEKPTKPETPNNELTNDLNKGYSIIKKSIKDFVGKMGE